MTYKTEMGYRVADSFADLMAMYRLLKVRLVEEFSERGSSEFVYRYDRVERPIGGSSSRFEEHGNTKMVWDAAATATYRIAVPRGHGLLKLSQGDEAAVEDFVAAFPPSRYSFNFSRTAADATETHVFYEFSVGADNDSDFPQAGRLSGGVEYNIISA